MHWEKRGLIFVPEAHDSRLHYACLPVPMHHKDDVYRVFFASRDEKNCSHVWFFDIRLCEPFEIVQVSSGPVFSPGPMGTHDEHGVFPSSIVVHEGRYFLYTSCWNRGERPPLNYNTIGLAISEDGETFRRYSRGPILARSDYDPCFVAMPMVRREADRWRMWYSSGCRWEESAGELKAFYNIRHAESQDGLNWKPTGHVAIEHATPDETCLARAWVLQDKIGYRAWYGCARGAGNYRIGYAESRDGLAWQRHDQRAGIALSESGWDSQMIVHPALVQHDGRWFMFYNGNRFAKDGVGLAIAESLDR